MSNIAVIGGSFNPPHLGHMQLGELVGNISDIDEVWYIPNNSSVFGKNLISYKHRECMVEMMVNRLTAISVHNKNKHPRFVFSNIEHTMKLDGYTLSLANALTSTYKNHNFSFVIGQDIANCINKYKHYDKLVDNYRFIISTRPGYTRNDSEWLSDERHVHMESYTPLIDVSSTYIRNELEKGHICALFDKLPIDILEYLIMNKLYH